MKKITVILFILLNFSVYSKDINEIKNQINKNQIFSWEIKEKVKLKVNMDLNGDGKNDILTFYIDKKNSEYGELCVNNQKIKVERINSEFSNFFIMDADKNDNLIEFGYSCVYDNGLYDQTAIYRYSKKIIKINKENLDFYPLEVSGDGKLYFSDGLIYLRGDEIIEENDILRYYNLKEDKIVENEIKNRIKIYKCSWNMVVYNSEKSIIDGAPVEEETKIPSAKEDGTLLGILRPGDKFEILKIEPNSDHVKIKLSNGKIGWIGGNHMVWD